MRTASFLALALAVGLVLTGRTAAQPPMKQPLTPQQIYAKFRDTVAEGKYDIAGIFLDEFLASVPDAKALADPTEKAGTAVFVELESKYGTTAFQQLRAVPRYSDDPAAEKKVRAAVEDLNARALAVKTKLLYTPERVNKYIRNLGETYEEKLFAQQELKRTAEALITYVKDRPGHDRRYAIDARKLESELGWKPAETFETGIRKTVLWYLENTDWVKNVQSGAYREWIGKNYQDRQA